MYLRNVKGYPWNHKRVYRLYRELELNLRIKPKRRCSGPARTAGRAPANQRDVVHGLHAGSLADAAAFGPLTSSMTIIGRVWYRGGLVVTLGACHPGAASAS